MNLIDKLIVVTGAASGIGAESGYYFDDTKRDDECKRDAPVAQFSGSPRNLCWTFIDLVFLFFILFFCWFMQKV